MDINEVLEALPESLRPLIEPKLKELDQGYQTQIEEVNKSYEDLKSFQVYLDNNIDPAYVEQAVMLADQLQREPDKVISQINDAWKLGFVSKEEAEKLQEDLGSQLDDWDTGSDISKHPQFLEMKQALEELQGSYNEDRSKQELEAEIAQFDSELDALEAKCKEENLPFNRLFVAALASQDVPLEDAVKQYHEVVGADLNIQAPEVKETDSGAPVVMGGNGSGSGSPDGTVDFGSMSKNDLNSAVADLVAKAQQSGQ